MAEPSLLDLLNKNKPAPKQAENKPADFSALKNSLGNSSPQDASRVTTEVVAQQPQTFVPEKSTSLPVSKDNLAGVDLSDIDTPNRAKSAPAFFSQDITDQEFNSPEQKEAFEKQEMENIKEALKILEDSLDDKELVSDAVRYIFQHVQQHPFLADMLAPEDIGLMVRGLRNSYASVVAKKSERSNKRATNAAKVDEIAKELGDFTL